MTVIVTLISQYCTVHATDSFITKPQPNGCQEICEAKRSKIVPVLPFRGAMSYWGLAEIGSSYTFDWLSEKSQESEKYQQPEEFALYLCDQLNSQLAEIRFKKPIDAGIGIHFTAYEWIDNYWIPELFVLSNFYDQQYTALHDDGVILTRQTYNVAFGGEPETEHREAGYRRKVHQCLLEGKILFYNNGDPEMFNPIAGAILNNLGVIAQRKQLVDPKDVTTYREMASLPIKVVSKMQRKFCRKGQRIVGGKPHNLSITQNGEVDSDTGDAP